MHSAVCKTDRPLRRKKFDSTCDGGTILVLEYEVHGRVVGSGAAYDNRFVSIVTLENRKIARWRDYMDSLAAMRSLSTKV